MMRIKVISPCARKVRYISLKHLFASKQIEVNLDLICLIFTFLYFLHILFILNILFQFDSLQNTLLWGKQINYLLGENLQSHIILTMSHWSSVLPVCFPSQGAWVQNPCGGTNVKQGFSC